MSKCNITNIPQTSDFDETVDQFTNDKLNARKKVSHNSQSASLFTKGHKFWRYTTHIYIHIYRSLRRLSMTNGVFRIDFSLFYLSNFPFVNRFARNIREVHSYGLKSSLKYQQLNLDAVNKLTENAYFQLLLQVFT